MCTGIEKKTIIGSTTMVTTRSAGARPSPSRRFPCSFRNQRFKIGYLLITAFSLVSFSFQSYVLNTDDLLLIWCCPKMSDIKNINVFIHTSKNNNNNNTNSNTSSSTTTQNGNPGMELSLSHVQDWWQVNDTLLHRRMSDLPLSLSSRYSFVHISKTAGTSWIMELKQILGKKQVKPSFASGVELSVAVQQQRYGSSAETYMMTSFKHPRAHTWSLWAQCVFATDWGKVPKIPYSESMSYEDNFENWLDIFVLPIQGMKNNSGVSNDTTNNNSSSALSSSPRWQLSKANSPLCYHPANYQTRPLVSNDVLVKMLNNRSMIIEPDLNTVRRVRTNDFAWISISEFFHESKCLLFHRWNKYIVKTQMLQNDTKVQKIQSFLNEQCRCVSHLEEDISTTANATATTNNNNNNNNNRTLFYSQQQQINTKEKEKNIKKTKNTHHQIHATHYTKGRRNTTTTLHPRIHEKIDTLTRMDTINYRESLLQFLLEISTMELELNRRVLCDSVLQRWEKEFMYLHLPQSLSSLYKSAQYVSKQSWERRRSWN